jgi:hypothetical protein
MKRSFHGGHSLHGATLSTSPCGARAGHSYATNARSAWADLPSTRFLNEIGNDPAPVDSDPSPVAPDPAVSNDGEDLPRVRIENDVLGKDEILSHGFCLEDDGLAGPARVLGSTAGQVLARFGQGAGIKRAMTVSA